MEFKRNQDINKSLNIGRGRDLPETINECVFHSTAREFVKRFPEVKDRYNFSITGCHRCTLPMKKGLGECIDCKFFNKGWYEKNKNNYRTNLLWKAYYKTKHLLFKIVILPFIVVWDLIEEFLEVHKY